MVETGHFRELQSIIEMLPMTNTAAEGQSQNTQNCLTFSNLSRKKRQTFVFSATIALSADFRKKLKRGSLTSNQLTEGLNSIEILSERAGMRANAAIVDLTNSTILAQKLEESFIEYVLNFFICYPAFKTKPPMKGRLAFQLKLQHAFKIKIVSQVSENLSQFCQHEIFFPSSLCLKCP